MEEVRPLMIRNDKKKASNTSELKRVYLLTYNHTRISSFMDIFCPHHQNR
jgi:hypothetical protein